MRESDAPVDRSTELSALARAANAGDVGSLTVLGNRLLTGDGAPWRPHDGAGLLIRAMEAGGAEAAARLAVLVAAGAYVRQSWGDALDLLARAAERGWEPARAQLRLLAGERMCAEVSKGAAADPWLWLAATIDLQSWLAAPPGHSLQSAPLVRTFEGLIPDAVCDWLMEAARPRLARARVYDSVGGGERVEDVRSNRAAAFNLNQIEIVHLLVQARMAAACSMPVSHMEAPAVLHYSAGEQFDEHFDFLEPAAEPDRSALAQAGQRTITFLAYLNDSYTGGETYFPMLGIAHRGRRGQGLYFVNTLPDESPDRRTLHAGLPPSHGEKWVVSQFVRTRAFMPTLEKPSLEN